MSSLQNYLQNKNPFPIIYPPVKNGCRNVLLIDHSIADANLFATSANENTYPIIYSVTSTKTEVLSLLKQHFTTIDRIGIVFASSSSSNSQQLFLDVKPFFTEESESNSENVDFLVSIIKDFSIKNIDYLACNTLQYPNWVNYYTILSNETGVVVGASNDKTGNIKYGGDWIMESTSQNIEFVYFTKSIEYYQYLLDNPYWSSGFIGPVGITIHGDSMYVANYGYSEGGGDGSTISQINLSDGSITNANWATGLNSPLFLVTDTSYMYVSNFGYYNLSETTITKIDLLTGSIIDASWSTGFSSPAGLAIDASYLYVSNYTIGTISKIRLSDGSVVDASWSSGFSGPFGLRIDASYLYVANDGYGGDFGSTISKVNLSDGSVEKYDWVSGLAAPVDLAIAGSYMYVSSLYDETGVVSQINLSDGSIEKYDWVTGFIGPTGLVIDGSYIYVANIGNGAISQINLDRYVPPPTIPEAMICFPANTPVVTDQGIIAIDKINPDIHTIHKKRIVDVTKTITPDNYLVCFEKDSLDVNYPTKKTMISKNHKIYYRGQMLEAVSFLGHFEKVYRVKYNGEILYNILMEDHSKMLVNNLICETLHPENIIAKLYTRQSKYSNKERKQIIMLLDECSKQKKYKTYNKIIKSL